MKKNMSTTDRILRLIVVIVLVAMIVTHVVAGTMAVILAIVAAIFTLTSLIGFCPLYRLFGLSTCKRN